jgi:L-fuconolactonase
MIIDTHQHFIFPSRIHYPWLEGEALKVIQRDFTPTDLALELEPNKVQKTILVQTRHSLEETHEFLQIAAETDYVAGVTAWVDLTDPNLETTLQSLLKSKNGRWLKGIRHQIQEEPDPNWLLRQDVQQGLLTLEKFGLLYEFVCSNREYSACLETAKQQPKLQFILDHAGKPDIQNNDLSTWQASMQQFAELENVVVKISGLTTQTDQTDPKFFKPYVQTLIQEFGSSRCMYGSDYPICLLAAQYAQTINIIRENSSKTEQQTIFRETATKIYQV